MEKFFFDQPVESDMRTYDNIRKLAIGQGDNYTAGCLLIYNYFNKYYEIILKILIRAYNFIEKSIKRSTKNH